jgi:DNA-binding transcriptional LysR family regulator
MNLRQIEVFSTIMRTGSVTEAAKALNVSQPSVSKVLKHTEVRLGFPLFKRISGRLFPTQEAEILYAETSRIDEDVNHLSQLASELSDGVVGRARLGCPPSLSTHILPMGIQAFRAKCPNISVQLTISPSALIRSEVIRRRVDLSLAHFPTSDPEIDGVTLGTGRMVCLMRNDHELAKASSVCADDLLGRNMIFGYADQDFLQLIDRAAPELRKNASCDLLVNHFTVAASLAQRGLGVALVDEFTVTGGHFDDLAIVPFEPEIPIHVGVIYPRYKPLSTVAQRFIETLGDALTQFRKHGRLLLAD